MAQPTYEQLLGIIAEKNRQMANLQARVAELEAQVARLEAQVQRLTLLLEQSQRANKRQAAPFSPGPPKADPKPPGRKPGADYGKPAFRAAPPPGQIDEVHEAVLPDRWSVAVWASGWIGCCTGPAPTPRTNGWPSICMDTAING